MYEPAAIGAFPSAREGYEPARLVLARHVDAPAETAAQTDYDMVLHDRPGDKGPETVYSEAKQEAHKDANQEAKPEPS